ncbi:YcdB/YcdC domain-containing protein [Brevibacillus laterosporus]|uniref:YcdB/YcdC domain-containing protein n=1 Tax=Brevibacillus laterosporus TaxID=1465 RepID=UPI00215BE092|nr:YcdB/YcdC domain-containing protein [Brevibacillus laterosporus]MCR8996240.1 hypothetical protein [Brevibacillus laterosporus]
MNFPDDKALFRKIRESYDSQPRREFPQTLDRALMNKLKRRQKQRRWTRLVSQWGLSVAVILLLVTFANPLSNNSNLSFQHKPISSENEMSHAAKKTIEKLYGIVPALQSAEKTFSISQAHRDQYRIILRKKENNKAILYADAQIDASDGTLLSLFQENPSAPDTEAPSEAVAKKVAEEFLTTMLGTQKQQYRLGKVEINKEQKVATVFYQRYVNDIPVAEDNYAIGVGEKGTIRYANAGESTGLTMDISKFKKPVELLEMPILEKKFAENLQLVYMPKGRKGPDAKTYELKYRDGMTTYLNAQTGEQIQVSHGYEVQFSPVITVTPGKKQVIVTNPQEATDVLASFGVDTKGLALRVSNVPKYMMGEGETEYDGSRDDIFYKVITLGDRVKQFSIQKMDRTQKIKEKKFSDKELEETALEFLQPYLDESVTEFRMLRQHQKGNPSGEESIVFYRSYQGVPIFDQTYKITIDVETKTVLGMFLSLSDGTETFADIRKALSSEEAARKYIEQNPVKLEYAFPMINGRIIREPVLAYTFEKNASTSLHAGTQ